MARDVLVFAREKNGVKVFNPLDNTDIVTFVPSEDCAWSHDGSKIVICPYNEDVQIISVSSLSRIY